MDQRVLCPLNGSVVRLAVNFDVATMLSLHNWWHFWCNRLHFNVLVIFDSELLSIKIYYTQFTNQIDAATTQLKA